MLIIIDSATENEVARQSANGAQWTFMDDEFQQRFETPLIEGASVLGPAPLSASTEDGEEIIGDPVMVLMPGDEGFAEAFWDEVLGVEYELIEEGENAASTSEQAAG